MRTLSIIGILISWILSGCNNPQATKTGNVTTGKEIKQDSIVGYAAVNGLKMYYEIHGTGTPLVLIHGGGSTIESNYGRMIPLLDKTHKVIAVEMQAHGHTADIDRPLSFEQDADDISALLKQLGIPRADIMGFSNGASTTLEMAIRHPEQVNKIIVASTFYKKDGAVQGFWDMMAHPTFQQMPQPLKDAYLKINPDTNALYTMYKRDITRMQSFKDISDDDIKSIKAPAFIIIGDHDVVRPEHAVEMAHLIPQSRLAILPGTHGSYLGEIMAPKSDTTYKITTQLIENFLNEPFKN